MSAHPLISLDQVSYRPTPHHAMLVHDISLSVHQGEIISIIGPNGAGKSTTLKLLVGLLLPSHGTRTQRQATPITYVPQAVSIPRHTPMTAQDLIDLNGKHHNNHLQEFLSAVELEASVLRQSLHSLSGGELQRLLLARAMLQQSIHQTATGVMFLDEPLQGVSPSSLKPLYQSISQARDRLGCAVVMISHDVHLVLAATDTVYCLNRRICCHGSPQALTLHPEYKRLFGDHADALAVYQHQHTHCDHDG